VSSTGKQSESEAPAVRKLATQGAETQGQDWSWVEASVWTERMLAALENGVKGGNKFFAAQGLFTMTAAWKLASQSR
jgi:RNA-directed DNA polymerase